MMPIRSTKQVQSTFSQGTAITNRAKQLIQKHPGIYSGNLINRLKVEIESITPEDVNRMLFQLSKENYDFKGSLIYPPKTIKPFYKQLRKFTILRNDLNGMDFEIFMAITELKGKANFSNTLRKVISQNTDYSERDVKYRSGILFRDGFILARPSEEDLKYLDLNWDLIEWKD